MENLGQKPGLPAKGGQVVFQSRVPVLTSHVYQVKLDALDQLITINDQPRPARNHFKPTSIRCSFKLSFKKKKVNL